MYRIISLAFTLVLLFALLNAVEYVTYQLLGWHDQQAVILASLVTAALLELRVSRTITAFFVNVEETDTAVNVTDVSA